MNNKTQIFSEAIDYANKKDIQLKSKRSLDFFNHYVTKNLNHINTSKKVYESGETSILPKHFNSIVPGELILFDYNPKNKKSLAYYDKLPLVIPLYGNNNTFFGMNLHYLEPAHRAKLLNIINQHDKNKSMGLLSVLSKTPFYSVCIRQYSYENIISHIQKFNDEHWEIAIYLPTAQFKKASEKHIMTESNKKIQQHKKRK